MKKIHFFPLWKIEELEWYLEEMEQIGYRLDHIRWSYCFYFKEARPKKMQYFLTTCASFRGVGIAALDDALVSSHKVAAIQTQMCYYSIYRTKEGEDQLSLLLGARMDYVRVKLLEHALTALSLSTIFAIPLLAAIITQSAATNFWNMGILIGVCLFFTVYYLYGYVQQKKKCRKYELGQCRECLRL